MSMSTFVPPVQQTATVFATASATPSSLSSSGSSSSSSGSSNVGGIAGGVAGGAVALVALSLLGWLFFKKQRSKRELAEEEERLRADLANFRDPGTGGSAGFTGFDADAALASPEMMEKISYGHHNTGFPSPGMGAAATAAGAFAGVGAGAGAATGAYMAASSSGGHDPRAPSTIYPDAPAFYSQAPAQRYASGMQTLPLDSSRPLSYDPTVVAAPYTTLSMVGYPTPVSSAPVSQMQQHQLYPIPSMSSANRDGSMYAPTPVLTSTPAARYAQAGSGWENQQQQVAAGPPTAVQEGGADIAPPYSSGPAVAVAERKGGGETALGRAPTYKTKAGNSDSSHEDPSGNMEAAATAAAAAAATRDREREARARAYPPRAGSATGQQQRGRLSRGNSFEQQQQQPGSRSGSVDANDPAHKPRMRTESNASAQSSSSEHSYNIARKPVPRISLVDEPVTRAAPTSEDAARSSLGPRPLPPVPMGGSLGMPNPHISLNPNEGPHLSLGTDFGNAVTAALAQSGASSSAVADDGQRLSLSGRRRTLPPVSPSSEDAYGGLA